MEKIIIASIFTLTVLFCAKTMNAQVRDTIYIERIVVHDTVYVDADKRPKLKKPRIYITAGMRGNLDRIGDELILPEIEFDLRLFRNTYLASEFFYRWGYIGGYYRYYDKGANVAVKLKQQIDIPVTGKMSIYVNLALVSQIVNHAYREKLDGNHEVIKIKDDNVPIVPKVELNVMLNKAFCFVYSYYYQFGDGYADEGSNHVLKLRYKFDLP
jgi:hypothetical protein